MLSSETGDGDDLVIRIANVSSAAVANANANAEAFAELPISDTVTNSFLA